MAEPIEKMSPVREMPFPGEWFDMTDANHFWFRWRLDVFLRRMRALGLPLSGPSRALDVGCGDGTLARQVEAHTAWTVDAADLNMPALSRCAKGRGRILYYDILDAHPELIGRYNYVLLFDVLEHIEDELPFLRAALVHLVPGGHLALSVPALGWLYGKYDQAAGHHRRYGKRSLLRVMRELDVDIVDVRYWGMSLVPLLFVRKLAFALRKPTGTLIRQGFVPPGPAVHLLMHGVRRLEQAILRNPWFGSGLFLAARKRA